MRIINLFVAAGLLMVWSCQENSGPKKATSPEGYEYTLLKKGTGEAKPEEGGAVSFHILQRNGEEVLFDSRAQGQEQKMIVDPTREKSPIDDVLSVLSVGDSVTIPFQIDTMPNLPPDLQGVKMLEFDVVVTGIESKAVVDAEMAEQRAAQEAMRARESEIAVMVTETADKYKKGQLKSQIQTTDTGLKYIMHEEGTGAQPEAGQTVSVHYYGALTDGSMFDNSFARGQALTFPIGMGRVIPGWDQGIPLLKEGGKATLFIPSDLAYGEQGSPPNIPPNSELIFYVELEEVQ